MAGCEGDVTCSCVFEGLHPFIGIESDGIESGGSLGIFILVEIACVEIPFALCEHTVDTPMKEDSEATVGEMLPCF